MPTALCRVQHSAKTLPSAKSSLPSAIALGKARVCCSGMDATGELNLDFKVAYKMINTTITLCDFLITFASGPQENILISDPSDIK